MLLAKELPQKEKERHIQLIRNYSRESLGTDNVQIEFLANGAEKGVYKVAFEDRSFLAAAAAIDKDRRLLEEYTILHELFEAEPSLFPRPVAHYSSNEAKLGELITMELLPHQDLNRIRNPGIHSFYRDLSRKIGKSIGRINLSSGRYPSEPHDGNILGMLIDGEVDIKFCDAIQFLRGDMKDAVRAVLSSRETRPECYRFIKHFRDGLVEAILEKDTTRHKEDVERELDFVRVYNPIF